MTGSIPVQTVMNKDEFYGLKNPIQAEIREALLQLDANEEDIKFVIKRLDAYFHKVGQRLKPYKR